MEIDRQALLEQKRQRLLELRQRRLEKEAEEKAKKEREEAETKESEKAQDGESKTDILVKTVNRVDFAVQVGEPGGSTGPFRSIETDSVIRFDKAIQVSFGEELSDSEEGDDEEEKKAVQVEEVLPPEPSKEEVVNEALSSQLESQLHIPFSKLRLGIKEQKEIKSLDGSPFSLVHMISGFVERPIVDIQTTPEFPDLVLVAYGESRSKMPDLTNPKGLAIIYNIAAQTPFPEFFLHATSTISCIVFDKTDSFRIVAGMENGRIVLWDLTNVKPNQLSVTPSLQTLTLASFRNSDKKGIMHHTSRIVKLEQPEASSASPTIVSICSKGIINVWSLSMLAFPKLPSKIVESKNKSGFMGSSIEVSDVLISSNIRASGENSYHAPEFRFLNNTFLGTGRGEILKLKNSKEGIVDKSLRVEEQRASVLSVAETTWKQGSTRRNFLISSHLDWSLKLWQLSSRTPLFVIPTKNFVSKVIMRPGYSFQMATLNTLTPPQSKSSVDFWDLEFRTSCPICSVPVEPDFGEISRVAFDDQGESLMLASKLGKLSIWRIDMQQLAKVSEEKANRDIDKGIMHYLNSVTFAT